MRAGCLINIHHTIQSLRQMWDTQKMIAALVTKVKAITAVSWLRTLSPLYRDTAKTLPGGYYRTDNVK